MKDRIQVILNQINRSGSIKLSYFTAVTVTQLNHLKNHRYVSLL